MRSIPFFLVLAAAVVVMAAASKTIYEIPLKDIDGKPGSLKTYEGDVLLIVNVASKCGYTPQYAGLEELNKKYKGQGLRVLGFPSNDFGGQEPGTSDEIKEFCSSKFGVTFPMFEKVGVKGKDKHPLYQALTGEGSPFPGEVGWNFNKFLISRDGKIIGRYESKVKPDSPELVRDIEAALAKTN